MSITRLRVIRHVLRLYWSTPYWTDGLPSTMRFPVLRRNGVTEGFLVVRSSSFISIAITIAIAMAKAACTRSRVGHAKAWCVSSCAFVCGKGLALRKSNDSLRLRLLMSTYVVSMRLLFSEISLRGIATVSLLLQILQTSCVPCIRSPLWKP